VGKTTMVILPKKKEKNKNKKVPTEAPRQTAKEET